MQVQFTFGQTDGQSVGLIVQSLWGDMSQILIRGPSHFGDEVMGLYIAKCHGLCHVNVFIARLYNLGLCDSICPMRYRDQLTLQTLFLMCSLVAKRFNGKL